MARQIKSTNPGHTDEAYQVQILPSVSRTFALTIPQLPSDLSRSVTNAYLLCRVADTIEDEPQIAPPDTLLYMERFSDAVAGVADAQLLGRARGSLVAVDLALSANSSSTWRGSFR